MQSPSTSTLVGSPSTQWSNFSPRSAAHFNSLMVPLTEMSSSSPVIRNEIEPFGLPPLSARYCSTAATHAGDAALHVDRAAAIQEAVLDLAGERAERPGGLVAGRHHVGVAGEGDVRRFGADAGVEIVDVGGARFAEGDAMHLEAGVFQQALEDAERAGIGGGDGRAADEVAGDGNGVIHGLRLNTPNRRRASRVRHHFDLALLLPAGPRIAWRRRCQRVGAEPVGLARTLEAIHLDEAPDAQSERGNGERQVGVGIRKPVGELVVEAGDDEKRHHPPAAPVAIMQPLDRGGEVYPQNHGRADQLDERVAGDRLLSATDRCRDPSA